MTEANVTFPHQRPSVSRPSSGRRIATEPCAYPSKAAAVPAFPTNSILTTVLRPTTSWLNATARDWSSIPFRWSIWRFGNRFHRQSDGPVVSDQESECGRKLRMRNEFRALGSKLNQDRSSASRILCLSRRKGAGNAHHFQTFPTPAGARCDLPEGLVMMGRLIANNARQDLWVLPCACLLPFNPIIANRTLSFDPRPLENCRSF